MLDAHNRAFAFFGGVPRKVIYDSEAWPPSVQGQWRGARSRTRSAPILDNNARAWLFTPTPRFADFAALNAWLATRCRDLGARRHPTQEATIAEIFALEQPMLQPVSMPFDADIERPPIFEIWRVSSTCLVSVDRNRTSVPAEWVGKVVSVRISAHGIKVVAGGERAGRHERQVRAKSADLRAPVLLKIGHHLSILETKPPLAPASRRCRATGALRHGLPFTAWVLPPAVDAVRVRGLKQLKGDRAFAELLLVARETGLEALDMACQLAQKQGHLNTSRGAE